MSWIGGYLDDYFRYRVQMFGGGDWRGTGIWVACLKRDA